MRNEKRNQIEIRMKQKKKTEERQQQGNDLKNTPDNSSRFIANEKLIDRFTIWG